LFPAIGFLPQISQILAIFFSGMNLLSIEAALIYSQKHREASLTIVSQA